MGQDAIQENYDYYEDHKDDLMQDFKGRHVVIKDQEVKETFDSSEDAYKWASDKYRSETYIIQKVEEDISNFLMGPTSGV